MAIKFFDQYPTPHPGICSPYEERLIMGVICLSLQEKDQCPTVFREKGTDNVIKLGPHVHEGEYEALRLLYKQNFPVPEPLEFGLEPETGFYYIRMRYLEGDRLDLVWDALEENERASVLSQLADVTSRMRKNSAPYIGSLGRTVCNDNFLAAPLQPVSPSLLVGLHGSEGNKYSSTSVGDEVVLKNQWYGPFEDNKTFIEEGIISYLRARGEYEQSTELVVQMIRAMPNTPGPYVFTHGEIAPVNILVKGCKLIAILDWNQAGYYPDYWEYVKAHFWLYENSYQSDHIIPTVLEPHFSELSILLHARQIIW